MDYELFKYFCGLFIELYGFAFPGDLIWIDPGDSLSLGVKIGDISSLMRPDWYVVSVYWQS